MFSQIVSISLAVMWIQSSRRLQSYLSFISNDARMLIPCVMFGSNLLVFVISLLIIIWCCVSAFVIIIFTCTLCSLVISMLIIFKGFEPAVSLVFSVICAGLSVLLFLICKVRMTTDEAELLAGHPM